jgi:hypothetical protein
MNKWLITNLLIVSSICFHTGGFANPVKDGRISFTIRSATTTPRTLTFKKANIALPVQRADYGSVILFPNHGIRISCSVESYFLALPIFFVTTSCRALEEIKSKKEGERVLKDYLRHLFPSHYFW